INSSKPNDAKDPDYIKNQILAPQVQWASVLLVYITPETKTSEPTPRQVHAQFLYQLPLAGNAIQISQQQHAQQHFRIHRWPPGFAVRIAQLLPHKLKADVSLDQT